MRRSASYALSLAFLACHAADPSSRVARLCEPSLPATRFAYSDGDAPIPLHFRVSPAGTVMFTDNTPPSNPVTNAGATLGRVLFYDVRLSATDRVSCASCHRQQFGFGDTTHVGPSHGMRTSRRTMALANVRFYPRARFFWDERATSLEAQVLVPIHDTAEMALPPAALERKLRATSYYPALFAAAFGDPDVTEQRVAEALAQFLRTLVSAHSRFDDGVERLTAQERDGLRLFNASGCVNCHRTVAQIADKANNNGLDVAPKDSGADSGRFKPASLRNVAIRPPYMHDGRFATLEQVVDFYSTGVRDGPLLDPRMRDTSGKPARIHFSAEQRDALVAFLRSLTDSSFLRDVRFADPFPCRVTGSR
jgi:cytochrome c peroxidase